LLLSVAFLAIRTTDRRSALLTLVAGLLAYLLLALAISYVDRETGFFGKFYLFRPSSLTLFLALTAFVLIARETGATGNGFAKLRTAAVLILAPLFVWQTVKSQVATFATQRYRYPDLVELREFVDRHSAPDAVILVDPDADMTFPGVAMPLLLNRPTLVSYKFVPTDPSDIYRWHDLMSFKRAVFEGACPGPLDPQVDYLLLIDASESSAPACGRVVWRSQHFALAEVGAAARHGVGRGRAGRPALGHAARSVGGADADAVTPSNPRSGISSQGPCAASCRKPAGTRVRCGPGRRCPSAGSGPSLR